MTALAALALVALAQTSSEPGVLYSSAQPKAVVQDFFQRLGEQIQDVKVGQWVRYECRRVDGGREKKWYFQMSVVGAQKDELGRDAVWIETEVSMHPSFRSPIFQLRALTATGGKGGLLSEAETTRVMLAFGPEKPKEASKEVITDLFKQDPAAEKEEQKLRAAQEPFKGKVEVATGKPTALMTYAGTLTATPVELKYKSLLLQRMWLSEQVPLLKLAKVEMPKVGHFVEVRDYGVDARSKMVLPGPNDPKLVLGDLTELQRKMNVLDEVDNP